MKFEFSRESSTSRSAHGEKNISFLNSTVLAYNLDNRTSFNLIATSTYDLDVFFRIFLRMHVFVSAGVLWRTENME